MIKTTLHFFYLDTSKEDQKPLWNEVQTHLKDTGFPISTHRMDFRSANPAGWTFYDSLKACVAKPDNGYGVYKAPVTLETTYLFDDQWNTAPIGEHFPTGARLWNACQFVFANKDIKAGYWLEQTADMAEVLRNTCKCGYCGNQEPAQKGYVFCTACLSSPHLKQEDLRLTRMKPIDFDGRREPLTQAEQDHLIPQYVEAQVKGAEERREAYFKGTKASLQTEYEKDLKNLRTVYEGKMWLLEKGIRIDNCIYHSHKNQFCFGWVTPVDETVKNHLLQQLSEFPYPYQIIYEGGTYDRA